MPEYDYERTSVENTGYRRYPNFKKIHSLKVVDLNNTKVTIPSDWGYYQYLILTIFPLILGDSILSDETSDSVIKNLLLAHIKKNTSADLSSGYHESYSDTYLLYLADDLQLLYINNLIPASQLKRLRSANDGEMRGAIYELILAAGFLRAGYKIKWLTKDGMPEFIATKNNVDTYVEAKRRNRSGENVYDPRRELRAIKKNLNLALKKYWIKSYIIYIDTDLPPGPTGKYREVLTLIADELNKLALKDIAIVITHNGFEYTADAINDGRTSTLIAQGPGSMDREDIKDIIHHINGPLPPSFSLNW